MGPSATGFHSQAFLCLSAARHVAFHAYHCGIKLKIEFTGNDLLFRARSVRLNFGPLLKLLMSPFRFISLIILLECSILNQNTKYSSIHILIPIPLLSCTPFCCRVMRNKASPFFLTSMMCISITIKYLIMV